LELINTVKQPGRSGPRMSGASNEVSWRSSRGERDVDLARPTGCDDRSLLATRKGLWSETPLPASAAGMVVDAAARPRSDGFDTAAKRMKMALRIQTASNPWSSAKVLHPRAGGISLTRQLSAGEIQQAEVCV
jgi:hypothetical protein